MSHASSFHSDGDIEALVAQFQARTLPSARWTHQAHLATAVWFLKHHSRDEATCYLRSGIIAYNVAIGGQNTPAGGYHETLTLFWIDVVARYLEATGRRAAARPGCRRAGRPGLAA